MILAIDIGNSRVKVGQIINDRIITLSADTRPFRDPGAYWKELNINGPVSGIIISSVVDELTDGFREMSRMICTSDPLVLDSATDTGISIKLDKPELIGPDRIANAAGGYHLSGGPVLIVDMGSATTLTVVGKDAEFMGGCILPGAGMMAALLYERTSRLPDVAFDVPDHVIGRDTTENINAGLGYGIAGAVERLIADIKKEIGYTMKVVLTGGMSGHFKDLISGIEIIDPLLTMKGLFMIYDRNQG